jgi:hypothetical protein
MGFFKESRFVPLIAAVVNLALSIVLGNIWGLFGIYDKTCNTYGAFSKHYPQCSRFEGEHQLNEKVLKKVVIPLIKEIS